MNLSELRGGVAVLTGSASGLGFSMAKQCRELGMHVVLSDIRQDSLASAVRKLKETHMGNGRVEGFTCDVTRVIDVEELLQKIRQAFAGAPIQFLAANAGVMFPKSTVLSGSSEEWDLTYKVNVLGVVNTLRTFVPVLVRQPIRSVVEITASLTGVIYGMIGPYGTSKLAVLGIAEALYSELKRIEALKKITVVALCPGIVITELLESGTQVSGGAIASMEAVQNDVNSHDSVAMFKSSWKRGMSPDYVAGQVMQHVREGRFYCILGREDERPDEWIRNRSASMLSRRHPWAEDAKL